MCKEKQCWLHAVLSLGTEHTQVECAVKIFTFTCFKHHDYFLKLDHIDTDLKIKQKYDTFSSNIHTWTQKQSVFLLSPASPWEQFGANTLLEDIKL